MKSHKKGSKGGQAMHANSKNNTATVAMAGVAGAVIGAGVAVAATKVMTDPKLREKVFGAVQNGGSMLETASSYANGNGNGTAAKKKTAQAKKKGQSKPVTQEAAQRPPAIS